MTLMVVPAGIDFPRLCRLVAQDAYLPRAFLLPGRRLVHSAGIGWLAVTAGLLLTVFGGITDWLIPLFAVGASLPPGRPERESFAPVASDQT